MCVSSVASQLLYVGLCVIVSESMSFPQASGGDPPGRDDRSRRGRYFSSYQDGADRTFRRTEDAGMPPCHLLFTIHDEPQHTWSGLFCKLSKSKRNKRKSNMIRSGLLNCWTWDCEFTALCYLADISQTIFRCPSCIYSLAVVVTHVRTLWKLNLCI